MIEFDIKLSPKDLYRFNIYQTYTGSQGFISILVTVLAAVMFITSLQSGEFSYTVMYGIFFVVFLVYVPVSLWIRAGYTIRTNSVLGNTLHYQVSDEAITVSQGEESGELKWNQIYKMVSVGKNVLIFSGRRMAYIIPRDQLGSGYASLKELAEKNLEKYRVKMK